MKRIIPFTILFFLITVGFYCQKEEQDLSFSGRINFLNGDVKLITSDGESKKAIIGDEIKQGMKIKTTGNKSFIEIYFGENAVKVLGNTSVDVKKLTTNIDMDVEKYEFFVKKGRLFSRIKRKLGKNDLYQIVTPTSTAGVRGTEFLVSETQDKTNIACLSGMVSVLNNSLSGSEPVVLNVKEEADVIPGQEMVKKQLSEDRLRKLKILLEIKAMRAEIRAKFEKQREEIRQHYIDQKERDKDILEKQKEKDKALVDDQKKKDKENIENIKGSTSEKGREATDKAKDAIDKAKNVDKDSAKREAEDQKEAMKPKIKKFKIDKDQFKPNQKE